MCVCGRSERQGRLHDHWRKLLTSTRNPSLDTVWNINEDKTLTLHPFNIIDQGPPCMYEASGIFSEIAHVSLNSCPISIMMWLLFVLHSIVTRISLKREGEFPKECSWFAGTDRVHVVEHTAVAILYPLDVVVVPRWFFLHVELQCWRWREPTQGFETDPLRCIEHLDAECMIVNTIVA